MINVSELVKIYPWNLANDIYNGDKSKILRLCPVVLDKEANDPNLFSPRVRMTVMYRYQTGLTLEQIANRFPKPVSGERVRQIINQALLTFGHRQERYLSLDYRRVFELERKEEKLASIEKLIKDFKYGPDDKGTWQDLSIKELNLSVRGYNCLQRAGIKTLGELAEHDYNSLCTVRNLGKRTADDIVEAAAKFGIEIC